MEMASINLIGKTMFADAMVIATGRSDRHIGSIASHLVKRLKDAGIKPVRTEGLSQGDWVLVDAGDVIVHLFRPEVRQFYNLEKMWSVDTTAQNSSGSALENPGRTTV